MIFSTFCRSCIFCNKFHWQIYHIQFVFVVTSVIGQPDNIVSCLLSWMKWDLNIHLQHHLYVPNKNEFLKQSFFSTNMDPIDHWSRSLSHHLKAARWIFNLQQWRYDFKWLYDTILALRFQNSLPLQIKNTFKQTSFNSQTVNHSKFRAISWEEHCCSSANYISRIGLRIKINCRTW